MYEYNHENLHLCDKLFQIYSIPFFPKRFYSFTLVGNFVYWVMELCPFTLVVEFQKCSLTLKGLYKSICGFFKEMYKQVLNGTYLSYFLFLFWLYAFEEKFLTMVCWPNTSCKFFLIPCNHFPKCEGYLKAKSHLVNLPNPTP